MVSVEDKWGAVKKEFPPLPSRVVSVETQREDGSPTNPGVKRNLPPSLLPIAPVVNKSQVDFYPNLATSNKAAIPTSPKQLT